MKKTTNHFKGWTLASGLMFALFVLSLPDATLAQRPSEKPRFGNGALLKRIFGDSSNEENRDSRRDAPPGRQERGPAAEKTVNPFEAARQRFLDDSEKLRSKLGWNGGKDSESKTPPEAEERDEPRAWGGSIGQGAIQKSISDFFDPRTESDVDRSGLSLWAPDRPDFGGKDLPPSDRWSVGDAAPGDFSGFSRQLSAPPATRRSGPAGIDAGSIGSDLPRKIEDPRVAAGRITDNQLGLDPRYNVAPPGPRNQPRVPSRPSSATVGSGALGSTSIGTIGDSNLELVSPTRGAVSNSARRSVSESLEIEEVAPPPAGYGAFGIMAEEPSPTRPGLRILSVKTRSVAEKIGLTAGDVLVSVAGLEIEHVQEIDSLVEVLEAGDAFEIEFLRQGKPQRQEFIVPE
jgi:hypothetical protein